MGNKYGEKLGFAIFLGSWEIIDWGVGFFVLLIFGSNFCGNYTKRDILVQRYKRNLSSSKLFPDASLL